ncbi:hypothetical protein [Paenibacillus qinlingensis]|uniref:hypothetical protein n=1 Tax=Paenibacillus qinlingensis TaxID=1837343 RepID=UPI001563EAD4|nr:hypothetical protein [Paenibacillus qinlingensis]NQX61109.1 hypothetical protein [Paenibacillus qinlingensis]
MSKFEFESIKETNIDLFYKVRSVINEFDPVSLIRNGAPVNEHEVLVAYVLYLLLDNKTEKLKTELIDSYKYYGFDPEDIKEEYKESFNRRIQDTTEKILEVYKVYITEIQ